MSGRKQVADAGGSRVTRRGLMLGGAALLLSGCSTGSLESFGGGSAVGTASGGLPAASGQVFGKGPVRVALLLPLSGDPALTTVGTSMANAAQRAI